MKTEFMLKALNEAKKAYKKDEVPIGAIIVKDGKVIAKYKSIMHCKMYCKYDIVILGVDKLLQKIGE